MSGGDGQGPAPHEWTDEELKAGFFAEMARLIGRSPAIGMSVTPVEAWAIMSNLQLALRHPANRGPSSEIARGLVERISHALGLGPAMREVLRRGWDAAYDLPLLP